jgi:ABC-type multidrug transport system ATPase subunit
VRDVAAITTSATPITTAAYPNARVFGFLGHNGAGKTMTIHALTTLTTPASGSARVCGFDVVTDRLDTDKNKLRIDVTASSPNVKVATFTVNLNAGGPAAGVE